MSNLDWIEQVSSRGFLKEKRSKNPKLSKDLITNILLKRKKISYDKKEET
jgi:hypothetical protein